MWTLVPEPFLAGGAALACPSLPRVYGFFFFFLKFPFNYSFSILCFPHPPWKPLSSQPADGRGSASLPQVLVEWLEA